MGRKRKERVFTIFIALVLVIILVSLPGNFVKAQTSSGGDGYANATIPNASIGIEAYLLPTEYSGYYGLHFDLYITSNYPSGTIVRYLFSIENGAGTMYSKSPYVKLTYESIPPGIGVWNYALWGKEIDTYQPTFLQLTYETTNLSQINDLIPAWALPLNISVSVTKYPNYVSYGLGYIDSNDIDVWAGGGGGGGGGGSCVYGLEPILMANGNYKPAENIKAGDKIMTYNFTTHSKQSGIVTKIDVTNESEMYIIKGILYLAPDQYVWTERGWIMAENLTYNDTIYNVNTGNFDPVISINTVNGTFPMYDFTINVNGNYIAFTYILKDLGGIHAC